MRLYMLAHPNMASLVEHLSTKTYPRVILHQSRLSYKLIMITITACSNNFLGMIYNGFNKYEKKIQIQSLWWWHRYMTCLQEQHCLFSLGCWCMCSFVIPEYGWQYMGTSDDRWIIVITYTELSDSTILHTTIHRICVPSTIQRCEAICDYTTKYYTNTVRPHLQCMIHTGEHKPQTEWQLHASSRLLV